MLQLLLTWDIQQPGTPSWRGLTLQGHFSVSLTLNTPTPGANPLPRKPDPRPWLPKHPGHRCPPQGVRVHQMGLSQPFLSWDSDLRGTGVSREGMMKCCRGLCRATYQRIKQSNQGQRSVRTHEGERPRL